MSITQLATQSKHYLSVCRRLCCRVGQHWCRIREKFSKWRHLLLHHLPRWTTTGCGVFTFRRSRRRRRCRRSHRRHRWLSKRTATRPRLTDQLPQPHHSSSTHEASSSSENRRRLRSWSATPDSAPRSTAPPCFDGPVRPVPPSGSLTTDTSSRCRRAPSTIHSVLQRRRVSGRRNPWPPWLTSTKCRQGREWRRVVEEVWAALTVEVADHIHPASAARIDHQRRQRESNRSTQLTQQLRRPVLIFLSVRLVFVQTAVSGAYLGAGAGVEPGRPFLRWIFFCFFNVKNMLHFEHFWKCTPEMYPLGSLFRFLTTPLYSIFRLYCLISTREDGNQKSLPDITAYAHKASVR